MSKFRILKIVLNDEVVLYDKRSVQSMNEKSKVLFDLSFEGNN